MPTWLIFIFGIIMGTIVTGFVLARTRNGKIQAEYEAYILELEAEHQEALRHAQKRSVNTSRAVLRGKVAEQFAPLFPEFSYLPADARFLGDPIDYVVFNGYNSFRDGVGYAEDIEVVLIDIKSGQARLTSGQKAIAQAIQNGRVRFETVHIELD